MNIVTHNDTEQFFQFCVTALCSRQHQVGTDPSRGDVLGHVKQVACRPKQ